MVFDIGQAPNAIDSFEEEETDPTVILRLGNLSCFGILGNMRDLGVV